MGFAQIRDLAEEKNQKSVTVFISNLSFKDLVLRNTLDCSHYSDSRILSASVVALTANDAPQDWFSSTLFDSHHQLFLRLTLQ